VDSVPTAEDDPACDDPGSPAQLRRLVAVHGPADCREASSKERFLAEIDRLERPCDETADLVHVTASALVVGRRGTVLHLHRRLGRWMQPGGHVDPGESTSAAALRESQEETGLSLAHPPGGPMLVHLDVHRAAQGHTHLDLRYLLVGPEADPDPPPGESPDARWYSWEEAEATADEALVGGLRAAHQVWGEQAYRWGFGADEGARGETGGGGR
jgi:8-oxo-dGTP pyrophosphatase MutT (NUDIX family)